VRAVEVTRSLWGEREASHWTCGGIRGAANPVIVEDPRGVTEAETGITVERGTVVKNKDRGREPAGMTEDRGMRRLRDESTHTKDCGWSARRVKASL